MNDENSRNMDEDTDVLNRIKQESFAETAVTLHNIRAIRNSEITESLINDMSNRPSIIN